MDFEKLRAERNASVLKLMEATMRKLDPDFTGPIQSTFDPNACYCACPDGPCEHNWNGPIYESDDSCCMSTTCSRCGCTSMSHDMRVGP